ncbi:hypothetical protein ACFYVL_17320 [Streptomyces sp. NPDC004111]|uniref:hypothetical protein n=1 Tax=Streptomyces sp. NPDC004111 TaxID=3364690 RepID=UPI003686A6CA
MATAPTTGMPLLDFYVLTDQVAQALGDTWDRDDTTSDDPQTVRFVHSDGRTVGIRRQFRGQGFQTYSTNPDAPRYNASGYFDDTTAPLDTVMLALQIRLFPAFYGNRLPLTLGGTRILPEPAPAPETPTVEAPAPHPAAQPATPAVEAAPEPVAKKPAPRRAPVKKAPAAPRKTTASRATAAKKTTAKKTATKAPAKRKPKPAPAA